MSRSQTKEQPTPLDPTSEWRAWQALSIMYTVLLNRQIQRRWLLEQQCMADRPISQRFRPVLFLEPVPTLHKPVPATVPSSTNTRCKCQTNQAYNPHNPQTMSTLRKKVHLLRARVEKGKELASEIERRMIQTNPRTRYPTHFCYTCVGDGEDVDVLLTKCGHRVCRTCLEFGVEDGVYECSICFLPAEFVARSPLGSLRSCSEEVSATVSNGASRSLGSASEVVSSSSSSFGVNGSNAGGKHKKGGHNVRFSCPTV
ncbi:hypothetical protein N7508_006314 [Penicillium antarcticum]|uniref:uncharacterized protein n=1 Tax=Penicillium antarcticum TaxID=416450 RepID=UPI002383EFBE|nr:uncharacterized protein N7508_006314 [Penicillium antarcticum]KAJ5301451.1 hypothetical protein N7508_006314 [Penicillium antarcticum]